jgi:hypothetical protein
MGRPLSQLQTPLFPNCTLIGGRNRSFVILRFWDNSGSPRARVNYIRRTHEKLVWCIVSCHVAAPSSRELSSYSPHLSRLHPPLCCCASRESVYHGRGTALGTTAGIPNRWAGTDSWFWYSYKARLCSCMGVEF